MRWGYFAACFGLSFLALFATLVVSSLVPQEAVQAVPVEVNAFTTTTRDFLLVVLLLTPWQAAGEEYLFRGYLTQAVGGMVGGVVLARVLAVLVPALLFALAHGAPGPPGLRRPVRLRGGRRGARDRHRRAGGGHRDARAQQLHRLRPGPGVLGDLATR